MSEHAERRGRGRPRAEPSEVQRARVVAAARRLFVDEGYDATTVAAIADEAGVARAVVYETVGDKQALLTAAAGEVVDELIAGLDAHFDASDARTRPLAELVGDDVRWFIELVRSDPAIAAMVRLSGRVALGDDDPVARARQRIEDRLTERHRERARTLGVEIGEAARLLSVMVLALMEGIGMRSADEQHWPTEEVSEVIVQFALGGYARLVEEGAGAVVRFDARTGRLSR